MGKYHQSVLKIAVLTAAFLLSSVIGQQNGDCNFLNDSPGVCGFLEECPMLSAIWNEVTGQTAIFKSLICGEDKYTHETLICCPKSETSDTSDLDSSSEFEVPIDTNNDSDNDNKIYFPDDPLLTEENVPVDVDDFYRVSYNSHPNFHLLPSLSECGNRESMGFDRIVGGSKAEHAEYPWLAQIGYIEKATNEIIFDCGGAVLNKNYILTAAHCVTKKANYTPVVVRLAEYNMTSDPDCSPYFNCSTIQDFLIGEIIIHEDYSNRFNDIALIRVKSDIKFDTPFIRPICLPFGKDYEIEKLLSEEKLITQMSTAAGWGRKNWNINNASDILQNVFLPIHSFESCEEEYGEYSVQISPKQICVGGEIGKDSCAGDSGGPVMIPLQIRTHKNRMSIKFFQLGVISYGPENCGEEPLPGVATRVAAYFDWILDNMSS